MTVADLDLTPALLTALGLSFLVFVLAPSVGIGRAFGRAKRGERSTVAVALAVVAFGVAVAAVAMTSLTVFGAYALANTGAWLAAAVWAERRAAARAPA